MRLNDVTKESAYSAIKKLVERFQENYESYQNQSYNETQTRIDFINPFFKALGWDMDNEQGFAEAYREVIHEDRVKVGEAVKAPDYCFSIQGQKKLFYVEAKKPSVTIKDDIHPSYQVRRYGWSAKLPISVVTDFEELAVYDTSVKPNPKDNASVARIKYITYDKYLNEDEFNFIWETFSKKRVLEGSFDKYVKSDAKKRGTSSVDKAFLESLDSWREELAKNITSRNKDDGYTDEHINYAVQNILDRIIFLRICEDRGVEPYGKLQKIAEEYTIYQKLLNYFYEADEKYNSGLFRFKKDRNDPQAPVDDITPKLIIDDKVLKKMIKELYYPESPYQFSEIPVEILGQAYEQFLGKVIRVTKGGICKVEEKPEVRKAGGVYYTPEYIVDYIVKNTVGKLIEGKKPKDIEKIKIVDPACGSGSFLIGAYKYLLNYHLEYYTLAKKQTKEIKNALTPDGRLTTNEKKRILLSNIYGLDIDSQAVEVTKLSLLLKAMEGETEGSIKQQMALFHERVLPTLDNNIKCGNSLIGTDFYDGELDLDNETIRRKVKPFDWHKAFAEIFNQGGFDAVIGNPPYLKERDAKEIFNPIMQSDYKKYHQGKMDYWYYFLHRAIDICRQNGFIGFITNSYWVKSAGATKLINRVKAELSFTHIVDFNDTKVFEGVSGKHMIHIYTKGKAHKNCLLTEIDKSGFNGVIDDSASKTIGDKTLFVNENQIDFNFSQGKASFNNCIELGDVFEVSQGVVEAPDKISKKVLANYSGDKTNFSVGQGVFVVSKQELTSLQLSSEEKCCIKKYLDSSIVGKYTINFDNEYLIYSDKETRTKIAKKIFPNIKKHLDNVTKFITSSNRPYGLHRPREAKFFEQPKLICKGMFRSPEFYYDDEKFYVGFSFSVIIQKDKNYDLKTLLALMNSKVGNWWFSTNGKRRGIGVDIGVLVFRKFPIPAKFNPDISNSIVTLVDFMLDNNKKLLLAKTPQEKQQLQERIDHTDKKIDTLVYKLYGLTDSEIKVKEASYE